MPWRAATRNPSEFCYRNHGSRSPSVGGWLQVAVGCLRIRPLRFLDLLICNALSIALRDTWRGRNEICVMLPWGLPWSY
jgi:hypothetical protein